MTIRQVVKIIASESDAKLPVVWGRLPKLARKWNLMILPNTWCCYGDWANKCTWNAWHIAQNRKRTWYVSVSDSTWMEVLPMCWGSRLDLWWSGWGCSCRKFQAEFFVTWWLLESIPLTDRNLDACWRTLLPACPGLCSEITWDSWKLGRISLKHKFENTLGQHGGEVVWASSTWAG